MGKRVLFVLAFMLVLGIEGLVFDRMATGQTTNSNTTMNCNKNTSGRHRRHRRRRGRQTNKNANT